MDTQHIQEGRGAPAYSVSKVALNVLTRKLAAELRGTGILVNSIDPGWLATDEIGSFSSKKLGELYPYILLFDIKKAGRRIVTKGC